MKRILSPKYCDWSPRIAARYRRNRRDAVRRFESLISPEPNTGCWLWMGATQSRGYGHLRVCDRDTLAHRFSYEHYVGAIPDGLTIDHLCCVSVCVNPAHLEPVTREENIRRSWAAGTAKRFA